MPQAMNDPNIAAATDGVEKTVSSSLRKISLSAINVA
jgi:hypothetical protein